jgi:amino acid adenylation domain-containing protein/thioester reductase-like protein
MSELRKQLEKLSVEKRELVLNKLRKQKLILDTENNNKLSTPTIERISRKHPLPLSFAQQRLWFLDQLEAKSSTYNIPLAVKIVGLLDVEVLEQAIAEIIKRHEVLRTTFPTVDGSPIQAIAPTLDLTLMVIDLQSLPEVDQLSEVQRLATEEAHLPFDLAKGPLLRGILLKLSESEYVLVFTVHHIVFDGWSMGILIKELTILYKAFSTRNPSPLPELTIQYADFAHWQRQWLCGKVLEDQLAYWKQQLSGDISVLQLPIDKARSLVQTFQEASQSIVLSKTLTKAIKTISEQSGATLFMTLLAAFQTLLYRYTGQEAISVGSPIANRNRSEIEGLIGFFANTLVLRVHLSGDFSFLELLKLVQEVALGAYANQDLPFEQIIAELNPDRKLSRTPLFQVMFVFQNTPLETLVLPGLVLSPLEVNNKTAKFDLTLSMEEREEGLIGAFKYNTDLFDVSTISRMVGHFQTLLEGIVANPQQKISELPLLSEAERHQLLVEWNNTQADYPQDKCIHQLFEEQVEKTPDAIAVGFENEKLTYRELNNRANCLAHYLQKMGVKPETLVGICIEPSLEMVVGLLGILKAGGAYLPLEPDHPQERLTYTLTDANVKVILTQEKIAQKLLKSKLSLVCIDTNWAAISLEIKENPISDVKHKNLAYVVYTSGSTGQPKGVAIEHQSLVNYLHGILKKPALRNSKNFALVSTIAADLGYTTLFSSLCIGACLHVISKERVFAPDSLVDYFRYHIIDCLKIVPSHLIALQKFSDPGAFLPRQLLILGGEASTLDFVESIQSQNPQCTILNHYGPTETTVGVLTYQVKKDTLEAKVTSLLLGKPIANSVIYILDNSDQPVPIGVSGELHIGGDGLARGYFNRPDLTAEKFIPDPFSNKPDARLYKTGDLARYLPDGNIEFLGRLDNQVKIRGFRIETGEIEGILEQHLKIIQAVVIHGKNQLEELQLVAYIVPKQNQFLTVNELRQFLQEKLPIYMVPALFIMLEAIPLTLNGKIDRNALTLLDISKLTLKEGFSPSRTPTEKSLVTIWADTLNIEKVGVYDNFFELGGHSLMALVVISKIRDVFSVELPVVCLFESPTIAEIAQAIDTIRQSVNYSSTPANIVIDLEAESFLDIKIQADVISFRHTANPKSILLTGATGFLGVYLLSELLDQTTANIYCLVRSPNVDKGKEKIQKNMQSYFLWNEEFRNRIIPIIGDLSQPLLGVSSQQFHILSNNIDVIYHNGAWVNFLHPYSNLKATNVTGTQEILRLASNIKIKPVHLVSTRSVVSSSTYQDKIVRESDELDYSQNLEGGYAQSKWVAEKLGMKANKRGIPVSIYRPGTITGHSKIGICNTNDLLWRMIKSCINIGVVPNLDMMIDMTPVDYVSRAIVHISLQEESLGKTFHLLNPNSFSWKELINYILSLGFSITPISYNEWYEQLTYYAQLSSDQNLHFCVNLLSEENLSQDNQLSFDCKNTLLALTDTDIICPQANIELFNKYFSYLTDSGFLDFPNKC